MSKSPSVWESLLDQAEFEFISAHFHDCGPDWYNMPRVMTDEMLHILHRGTIEWTVGQEKIVSEPGQVIFMPPQVQWEAHRISEELVRVTVIHFQATFPGGRRYLEAFGYPHIVTPPNVAHIEPLAAQLCRFFRDRSPGHALKERSLLYDIFFELFDCRGAAAVADLEGEQVWKIVDYMRQHLGEPISRETLSRQFYLSANHLAALFQRYTGQSLIHYLIRLRLEEARKLLLTTSLSVAEIAQRVGYDDAAYFSRLFRNSAGISPRSFREEQRQIRNTAIQGETDRDFIGVKDLR